MFAVLLLYIFTFFFTEIHQDVKIHIFFNIFQLFKLKILSLRMSISVCWNSLTLYFVFVPLFSVKSTNYVNILFTMEARHLKYFTTVRLIVQTSSLQDSDLRHATLIFKSLL